MRGGSNTPLTFNMVQKYKPVGVTSKWQKYKTFKRKLDAQREIRKFIGKYNYRLTKTNKGWVIYLKRK